MAHEISFYVENRVVLAQMSGEYTVEVARESNVTTVALVRAGQAPVHVIIEATKLTGYKINLKQLAESVTMLREPNLGWVIAVGGGSVPRFLGSMITQISRAHFGFADSLEEALELLQRVDATLVLPAPR